MSQVLQNTPKEHFVILSTCIKLSSVCKIFVLVYFWVAAQDSFTAVLIAFTQWLPFNMRAELPNWARGLNLGLCPFLRPLFWVQAANALTRKRRRNSEFSDAYIRIKQKPGLLISILGYFEHFNCRTFAINAVAVFILSNWFRNVSHLRSLHSSKTQSVDADEDIDQVLDI